MGKPKPFSYWWNNNSVHFSGRVMYTDSLSLALCNKITFALILFRRVMYKRTSL